MPAELRDAYLAASPHPENLQSFFNKCVERMQSFEDIPAETIRSIAAPTLVLVGDRDVMRPEHAVQTFRLLQHTQLAVLPDTEHMVLTRRTEWLAPMISEFLSAANPVEA